MCLPLGLLSAAGAARREANFDYPSTSNPRISLINLIGQVTVKGWDKKEVRASCLIASPRVEVDAEPMPAGAPAEKIHFVTHLLDPLVSSEEETTDYTLEIPLGASLEIRNRQGRVQIERLQGEAWVESAGGSISVSDVAGHLAVKSLGGDIEIIRPSGRVEASSINGNLRFVAPSSSKLRATTTSGRIVYEGDFASGGDYSLSTYSGDMEIFCPPSASYELYAKTVNGKLDNGLRIDPKRHPVAIPSSAKGLFGTHNTGRATVVLTSFSGTIRIRPQQ